MKKGALVDGYGGVKNPENVVLCLIDGVVNVVDFWIDTDGFSRWNPLSAGSQL